MTGRKEVPQVILDEEQKELIVEMIRSGYTNEEIYHHLGLKPSELKNILYEARKSLNIPRPLPEFKSHIKKIEKMLMDDVDPHWIKQKFPEVKPDNISTIKYRLNKRLKKEHNNAKQDT